MNDRVLLVDDEPRVTSALRAIFRRDYEVLIANSGQEALQILAENEVNVIVSDQRMPEMLGSELLAKVSHLYPNTMRLLLTGFMDRQAIVDSINHGEIYRFINKPWDNSEIKKLVAEAVAASKEVSAPANGDIATIESIPIDKTRLPKESQAILMIEKKQDIRNQIRKFCSRNQIMIYGTQNIEQALIAATSRKNIGVLVIELSVDKETTLETINLLKRARPELITIALTDEYDANVAVDLINNGQVFKYLAKPIDIDGFKSAVQNAFRRHVFLKQNKSAQKRFKVKKVRSSLSDNLASFFGRLNSSTT